MPIRFHDADEAPAPAGGYSQAAEVTGEARLLFISGQIPVAPDGSLAGDFEGQARQVWANLEAQLRAAGMGLDNLVKVTTFLGDRKHAMANRAVRQAVLGDRRPAMTVIVTGIFDEAWLLEIEAVAAG